MKKIIFIFLLFCGDRSFGQFLPNFDDIKLEHGTGYKAAEPFALSAANYLLSTPVNKDNPNRLKSLQFMYKWMAGTPDYSFAPDEATLKIMKGENDLLAVYMAGMAKFTLENKVASKDSKLVKLNAMIQLLNYCDNKNNNARMTKPLKKLAEAKEKGQLQQALL